MLKCGSTCVPAPEEHASLLLLSLPNLDSFCNSRAPAQQSMLPQTATIPSKAARNPHSRPLESQLSRPRLCLSHSPACLSSFALLITAAATLWVFK